MSCSRGRFHWHQLTLSSLLFFFGADASAVSFLTNLLCLSLALALALTHALSFALSCHPSPPSLVAEDSAEDPDAAFEARLASLKKAKGQMPYGESRKEGGGGASSSKPSTSATASPSTPARKNLPIRSEADYQGEELFFESGPHPGDATVNVALGVTLLWLPLTIAALGRAAFVRYRFTDRRLSVISTAPWKSEQLDADYRDVKQVVTVGRG